MAFFTHIGFAGSRLAVPLFAVDQGAGPFVVGTIVALYAALPTVLALPMGRMADRIGYKLPLLCGASAAPPKQVEIGYTVERGGVALAEISQKLEHDGRS